jgi:hypothetical protein
VTIERRESDLRMTAYEAQPDLLGDLNLRGMARRLAAAAGALLGPVRGDQAAHGSILDADPLALKPAQLDSPAVVLTRVPVLVEAVFPGLLRLTVSNWKADVPSTARDRLAWPPPEALVQGTGARGVTRLRVGADADELRRGQAPERSWGLI